MLYRPVNRGQFVQQIRAQRHGGVLTGQQIRTQAAIALAMTTISKLPRSRPCWSFNCQRPSTRRYFATLVEPANAMSVINQARTKWAGLIQQAFAPSIAAIGQAFKYAALGPNPVHVAACDRRVGAARVPPRDMRERGAVVQRHMGNCQANG